jgi:hydrogenase maturation protease
MNFTKLEKIVNAVLYEGYILYPYRASAVKNKQRWNFGCLYPETYAKEQKGSGDAYSMQTECLIEGDESSVLELRVKFLQMISREVSRASEGNQFEPVESLEIEDKIFYTWQEATERVAGAPVSSLRDLLAAPLRLSFDFTQAHETETLHDSHGKIQGKIVRKQEFVQGCLEMFATQLEPGLFKITARILNLTPFQAGLSRDSALAHSLLSTHTILALHEGKFISLLDPPEQFKMNVESCKNIGTWPVLVGDEPERDLMLSSPIILYDYPQVAAESAGELFDSTEIDEILSLRILALTDDEKRQMQNVDQRARKILERTEAMSPEDLLNLHGAIRGIRKTGEES